LAPSISLLGTGA